MKKQRKLIKDDRSILTRIKIDLRGYIRRLQTVKTKYEVLELGEFTDELFKKVKTGWAESEVVKKYWDAQNAQLTTAGITSKAIRESVLAKCQDPINEFVESLSHLYQLAMDYTEPVEYIRYHDGDFLLREGHEAELIEKYCREYINDDSEEEFVAALEGVHKALEQYLRVAGKVNATHRISRSFMLFDELFDNVDGKWKVSPSKAVYYHRFAKRNMSERRTLL